MFSQYSYVSIYEIVILDSVFLPFLLNIYLKQPPPHGFIILFGIFGQVNIFILLVTLSYLQKKL